MINKHGWTRLLLRVVLGVAAGALVTIPAAFFAVASAGLGLGDYLYAKLLYPWTCLVADRQGRFEDTNLRISLLQFPIYGAILGAAGRRRVPGILLTLVHAVAVVGALGA